LRRQRPPGAHLVGVEWRSSDDHGGFEIGVGEGLRALCACAGTRRFAGRPSVCMRKTAWLFCPAVGAAGSARPHLDAVERRLPVELVADATIARLAFVAHDLDEVTSRAPEGARVNRRESIAGLAAWIEPTS